MHWPLCNATKDAVPTFVSHRALCGLAAPITTIFREAKRGWPCFGASAFFFFFAMAFGARRPRPRLWRFQLCSAVLGLPAHAAENCWRASPRPPSLASSAFCGSAALWFLAAVRRGARLLSPGSVAGLNSSVTGLLRARQRGRASAASAPGTAPSLTLKDQSSSRLGLKSRARSSPRRMALEASPRPTRLRVKS